MLLLVKQHNSIAFSFFFVFCFFVFFSLPLSMMQLIELIYLCVDMVWLCCVVVVAAAVVVGGGMLREAWIRAALALGAC